MKESKPIYAIKNGDNISILWDTEYGKILVAQGKIDVNVDLEIWDVETSKKVDNIDLRNVLMSILPQ